MRTAVRQIAGLRNASFSSVTIGRVARVPSRAFASTVYNRKSKISTPRPTPSQTPFRFFDQYGKDPSHRFEAPPDETEEAREKYNNEMAQIDEQLRELTGKAIPNALAQMSKKDREGLGEEMQALSSMPDIEMMLRKGKIPGLSVAGVNSVQIDGISSYEQRYVRRLNDALILALAGADAARGTAEQALWKCYILCKQNVDGFLEHMSPEVWQCFWKIYLSGDSIDPTYVVTLAEDMISIDAAMDAMQTINYVQAVATTDLEKGLAVWRESAPHFAKQYKDFVEFQSLGVQLLSVVGELDEAESMADELVELSAQREARSYMPVLVGWAKQDDVRALKLYEKVREIYTINMEDYDAVSLAFLSAGKKDLALAVFSDMMAVGDAEMAGRSSIVEKMPTLLQNLQKGGTDASQVNALALQALTVIPKKFENKYFYASWIKKLIGMDEVDFAALVAELMYERGIKPDAKHINGIIGGWLRQGTAEATRRAEETAWAMIEQRLAFVQQRKSGGFARKKMKSVFESRDIPSATIETFSILVRHFLLSGQTTEIDKLNQKLEEAQIPPNSFFMNHLLYSLIRNARADQVWDLFQSMTHDLGVSPDVNSYGCLWDALRVKIGEQVDWPGFPDCRELYAMTVDCWRSKRIGEPMSKETFDQILQCTTMVNDYAAAIVALHAGGGLFGHAPDSATTKAVMMQIARNQAVLQPLKRSSLGKSGQQQHFDMLKRELKRLEAQRRAHLTDQSVDAENMSPAEEAQEALLLLSMLLRSRLTESGSYVPDHRAREILSQTAIQMGVPEINF